MKTTRKNGKKGKGMDAAAFYKCYTSHMADNAFFRTFPCATFLSTVLIVQLLLILCQQAKMANFFVVIILAQQKHCSTLDG